MFQKQQESLGDFGSNLITHLYRKTLLMALFAEHQALGMAQQAQDVFGFRVTLHRRTGRRTRIELSRGIGGL
jgi:hypothetical protein